MINSIIYIYGYRWGSINATKGVVKAFHNDTVTPKINLNAKSVNV